MARRSYTWPIEEMQRLYQTGMTCQEIAKHIGHVTDQKGTSHQASGNSVNRALRRAGTKMRKTGAPGARNRSWQGGRVLDSDGYVLVHSPDHPDTNSNGYVREHRLVMEQTLGRRLKPSEVVDHRDRDKANNAPGNLRLFRSNAEHLRETLKGRCPRWSPEGKVRIRTAHAAWCARRRAAREEAAGQDADHRREPSLQAP